ncbi:MAG: xanthine dehydrogenase family protein molybdopterin-binding subunit [Steroidobacteraceae bacterium]|jgi:carbon-monoxide dehydrogenase large subunit|nr:xanthine dehydrogenase family protein molybdopterin-binding subunit [Steroidobacteraceae bacterium]
MSHEGEQDRYVGRSVRNLGQDAFVSGVAKYTSDFQFPDQLHMHVVRSPHAHARIRRVDLSGARKVAGVVLAMEGQEAAQLLDPVPHYIDPVGFGGKTVPIRCLAVDKVWHYGQPVAVVVAEDKRTARYAASRVQVDYEPLPAVLDAAEAVQPGAPVVVPGWADNSIMALPFANGDVAQAFERADRVVRTTVRIHRFSTQPIETRVYNAVPDPETHGLTFYGTSQNPHPLRHVLARALRIPENLIRIIAPAVGGAFGMKMHGHPEEALVCLLALRTQKPVKWVEDREECLLIGAREQVHEMELALTKDGEILGLRDRALANTGAPSACPGWGMAFLTGLTMPGPYKVQDIDVLMNIVVTNKPSWNASRGYGKEATALALELAIDQAAREMGLDPVEMRIRNFVPKDAFPYDSPTGLIYDSGDYAGAVRKAMEALGYAEWRQRREESRQALGFGASAKVAGGGVVGAAAPGAAGGAKLIGIGLAYELTPEGGAIPGTMVAGYDSSTVRVGPDGSVTLLTGVTTPGTGNPTGMAQIVADELGVEVETIRVVQGDTTTCPYGFGNYSGRSTIVGGGAAALAAREVREKILTVAAALLGVDKATVTMDRGVIRSSAAPEKTLSLPEAAYACYTRAYDIGLAITPPLEAQATFRPGLIRHSPDAKGRINPYPSYSNAAYATVCEVDLETGQVKLLKFAAAHDCGKVINPILVEGQACGAISFGIGGMLNEEIRFDANGKQLTGSFVDYVMPRALDVPAIAVAHHDSPNPVTYLGLKGAGEAGVGGSAAAVVNAVNDALLPLGVSINDLPVTAPRVWAAIQAAKDAARPAERPAAATREVA